MVHRRWPLSGLARRAPTRVLEDTQWQIRAQARALLATLPQLSWQLMPVSNRVGQGSVPVGELTRRFVDQAGRLHQALALQCEPVVLVVAGCRWF
ncbi:hypothetical protein XSP_002974 [Xanthomonas sp. CPBF 426]|nr:hypothetical protein XSP_002974 [Xanthomonas sp. CPBF 426]CAG2093480.1 bifunctional adenosylcobinamide kinase/adenosylcobinamide-phosphate guanylyltransferase [Xanthomonas euroxanthea]